MEEGLTLLIQTCLKEGASLNAVGRYGQTLLHAAAERCYLDIVNPLLCRGASVKGKGVRDRISDIIDPWKTPITAAADYFIDKCGLSVAAKDSQGRTSPSQSGYLCKR